MNKRTLEYFITLAETLSFTKAANKHFIAQTTMSRQIAILEDELGFNLFERNTTKVILTQAGESYLADMKALLKNYERAVIKASMISKVKIEVLRVGHSGDLGQNCLGEVLNVFQKKYKNVEIRLFQSSPSELLKKLAIGAIDIATVLNQELESVKNICSIRACEVGIIIGVSKNHRFAGRNSLDSIELADETICVAMKDNAPHLFQYALNCCKLDGYEPKFIETDSFDNQKLIAQLGKGIAFFPDFDFVKKNENELSFIKLINTYHRYRIDFTWSKDNNNPSVKKFISIAENWKCSL